MSFTVTPLAGTEVLVEGTDVRGTHGQTVLNGAQWADVKRRTEVTSAVAKVDEAIEALLAPITEAVEAANAKIAAPKLDALLYVVETPGVDHVHGQAEVLTKLSRDSAILRAIEEGKSDRLIWLKDELVIAAAPVPQPSAFAPPADQV